MERSTEVEFLQPILEKRFNGMPEMMQNIFNLAMKIEREKYLHAGAYQKTSKRVDHVNRYNPCMIQALNGELELTIPQTWNTDFYPECLERGMRSERALRIPMAEMYIHGIATRKVHDILKKTCGLEVTVMQVKRTEREITHSGTSAYGYCKAQKLPHLSL